MRRYTRWTFALIATTFLGLAPCDRGGDPPPASDMDDPPVGESMSDMEGTEGVDGMDGREGMRGSAGGSEDGLAMQRRAREADSVATAMIEEMAALRAEAEELETASRESVRQRMPDHLDRDDRFVAMLEESAAHMRSM